MKENVSTCEWKEKWLLWQLSSSCSIADCMTQTKVTQMPFHQYSKKTWELIDRSLYSSLYSACRKLKKKTKPSWQLSIRGTYVNTRSRVNTLAPPTPGHSGHFRTPSRTTASFPGLNLAICSPRPTPSGAEQFQSELQMKQSKLHYNHLILVLLAIIGKKSKGKKATVLALSLVFI